MGYEFPDVPAALLELVSDSTLWLTSTDGTVHHIYSVGGSESGPLRTDRITIDTYAPGRTLARDAAEQVRADLVPGPHETETGLLDQVEVEVSPHDVPYMSDVVTQIQAIYRVDTRTL